MDPVVKSRTTLCKVRGKNDLKKKYIVEYLDKTYCAADYRSSGFQYFIRYF
jgi:hypothetical protein